MNPFPKGCRSDKNTDIQNPPAHRAQVFFINHIPQVHHHEGDEQSEKNIVVIPLEKRAVEGKIKWDLGDQGKQKETQHILFPVFRPLKSLHQQKAVDRKRNPPDHPSHDLVSNIEIAGRTQGQQLSHIIR